MPVVKMLDCSTGHVTRSDNDVLELLTSETGKAFAGVRIAGHEYGWFVSVPPDEPEEAERGMREARLSDAFVALVAHARGLGCSWINLDRDANPDPALPVHPW